MLAFGDVTNKSYCASVRKSAVLECRPDIPRRIIDKKTYLWCIRDAEIFN